MFRKIYYFLQIFPIIRNIENWYEVVLLYFFPDREVVLNTRRGGKFKIRHYLDALTVKEIFIEGDYEVKLKNPRVIIDIGANIGTFSILQSKKYPNCKIYSYEPSKSTYVLLTKNIKLNGCKNIVAENIGIWSKKTKTVFFSNFASGLSSLFNEIKREGTRNENVQLDSLKNVFGKNKIKNCDLLKMDCEGAEYEILLKTEKKLLKKIGIFIVEYHNELNEHKSSELLSLFKSLGYKVTISPHKMESNIGIIKATKK